MKWLSAPMRHRMVWRLVLSHKAWIVHSLLLKLWKPALFGSIVMTLLSHKLHSEASSSLELAVNCKWWHHWSFYLNNSWNKIYWFFRGADSLELYLETKTVSIKLPSNHWIVTAWAGPSSSFNGIIIFSHTHFSIMIKFKIQIKKKRDFLFICVFPLE